ncbi:MAG: transglutaminase-like domain-containing protein [Clostridiales bacterium]|nr:transglutaminase-like domain-containing protein [Clostridiales bacterium]
MKKKTNQSFRMRLTAISLLLLCFTAMIPAPAAAAIVTTVAQKTGVTVHSNDKVSIDASNLAEGYVIVKYTGGKDVRIKAQIAKTGGSTYSYDINSKGNPEILPITEGDGAYSIGVFENVSGSKYAQAYAAKVDVKLRDPLLPFLYANQYVNYTAGSDVDKKAQELVKGVTDTLDKLTKIYDFVTSTLTYDTVLAANVQAGYLPNVNEVLSKKKGICFDYAALMSSMLRLQGIPSRLCIGYAGTVYHAWIDVYTEEAGWIKEAVKFDGKKWTLMDPTFVSTSNSADAVKNFVGSGNSYQQKYVY